MTVHPAAPAHVTGEVPRDRCGQRGRIATKGGTAGAVIDLAAEHPEGGYDVQAPRRQLMTPVRVSGPVKLAHTADMSDPDAPIFTDGRPVLTGPGGEVDSRCPACVARVTIARDTSQTVLILEHERGCPELARWLQLAAGAGS